MTTFTLRMSSPMAARLNSGQMRSWIADFLRLPNSLPPDPGPGEDRISLTLPSESVHAVARFLRCSPSEALRRLALAAIGPFPAVAAAPRTLEPKDALWTAPHVPARSRPAPPSQASTIDAGDQLIGLIAQVLVIGLALLIWFFFSSRKGKPGKANMTA
jgi:hypothetical protein